MEATSAAALVGTFVCVRRVGASAELDAQAAPSRREMDCAVWAPGERQAGELCGGRYGGPELSLWRPIMRRFRLWSGLGGGVWL